MESSNNHLLKKMGACLHDMAFWLLRQFLGGYMHMDLSRVWLKKIFFVVPQLSKIKCKYDQLNALLWCLPCSRIIREDHVLIITDDMSVHSFFPQRTLEWKMGSNAQKYSDAKQFGKDK